MKLNKLLGYYIPSFFVLNVGTEEKIETILDTEYERTLAHELIHFLQDIATTYGLINLCKTVDIIKDQNSILRLSSTPVTIPLTGNYYSASVMANRDLFSIYIGDGADKYKEFPATIEVISIEFEEWPIDNVDEPVKSIEITLSINKHSSNKWKFHFGAACLLESMAHLIENTIYGKTSDKLSYPYDAALLLARYIYPEIGGNEIAVAELCEASLMTYHPGLSFIESLNQMKIAKHIHKAPNDTYGFVLNNMTFIDNDCHQSLLQEYKNQTINAIGQINSLFTVKPLSEDKWGERLIENASEKKEKGNSLVSIIFSADEPYRKQRLFKLVSDIGFPVAFNSKHECWIQRSGEHITPLYFLAILTFIEILGRGITECELINYCASESSLKLVNKNCTSSPWFQSKDQITCHFSQIWKMWGLESVEIHI